MAFSDSEIAESFAAAQRPRGVRLNPITEAFSTNVSATATTVPVIGCSISARTSEVAGDGFLYDDTGKHGGGRWTADVRARFEVALANLLRAGMSIRSIARVTGVSPATVRFYRRRWLMTDIVQPCACGQLATHQGWCAARFAASRKRQSFMATWHPGATWTCQEKDGFAIAWSERHANELALAE